MERSWASADADRGRRRPSARLVLHAVLALVCAAAILGVSLLIPDRQPIINSEGFLERSRIPLTDLAFYTSIRPFTTDLFFKVFGSDAERVVVGQMLVNALAWPFLGFCAARVLRNGVVAVAALLALASIGLWWNVLGWTLVMRSESACFSFFALWLGCLILFVGSGRWWTLALLAPVTVLFSFTRDNVPYLLIVVLAGFVPLLALTDRARLWRMRFVLGGFALLVAAVFLAQSWTVRHTVARYAEIVPGHTLEFRTRYQFNLINVIFKRILPDPVAERWFRERGMPPVDTGLWAGQWASSNDWALYTDDRYEPFRTYVVERFRGDLALFLLTHPGYALLRPLEREQQMWAFDLHGAYYYPPERTGLAPILAVSAAWSGLAGAAPVVVPAGLVLIGLGALFGGLLRRPHLAMVLSLGAGLATQALLIYHADAMEVERHSLLVPIGTLVLLAFAVLLAADGLVARAAGRPGVADARTA